MKTVSLPSVSFALVVALGATSGAAFAKGPGSQIDQGSQGMQYRCESSAPLSAPTAKSPQWNQSISCQSMTSARPAAQSGYTAAKTPSRPAQPMLAAD